MTNPKLLSIMNILLPALLPCYTFSFFNAENVVFKKIILIMQTEKNVLSRYQAVFWELSLGSRTE